jgi:hypothetical protein
VDRHVLDVALGALERREMRSLAWGFVDQSLGETEARETIERALRSASLIDLPDDVLEELCRTLLARMLTEHGERRYRTRFAELVRLLFRLRQWFPAQPWQAAPTLVSDFRVDTRQRVYPRRNIAANDAWDRIVEGQRLSEFQRDLWTALTGADRTLALSQFQLDATRRLLEARRGTATIVTAGTGSGKTLAFYLPALIAISPTIRPDEWWTRVVCLYCP